MRCDEEMCARRGGRDVSERREAVASTLVHIASILEKSFFISLTFCVLFFLSPKEHFQWKTNGKPHFSKSILGSHLKILHDPKILRTSREASVFSIS